MSTYEPIEAKGPKDYAIKFVVASFILYFIAYVVLGIMESSLKNELPGLLVNGAIIGFVICKVIYWVQTNNYLERMKKIREIQEQEEYKEMTKACEPKFIPYPSAPAPKPGNYGTNIRVNVVTEPEPASTDDFWNPDNWDDDDFALPSEESEDARRRREEAEAEERWWQEKEEEEYEEEKRRQREAEEEEERLLRELEEEKEEHYRKLEEERERLWQEEQERIRREQEELEERARHHWRY